MPVLICYVNPNFKERFAHVSCNLITHVKPSLLSSRYNNINVCLIKRRHILTREMPGKNPLYNVKC